MLRGVVCLIDVKSLGHDMGLSQVRWIAGAVVLASLALGYWVNQAWYLSTAFVGLNLLQSAFTNWCPMITFLRKLGVASSQHDVRGAVQKLS